MAEESGRGTDEVGQLRGFSEFLGGFTVPLGGFGIRLCGFTVLTGGVGVRRGRLSVSPGGLEDRRDDLNEFLRGFPPHEHRLGAGIFGSGALFGLVWDPRARPSFS